MNIPISIIIPVYNEEKRVEKGITRLLKVCSNQNWDFELIIVEDGCTDNTVEIVKKLVSKQERIKILSLEKRYGKGGSILQAIKHCNKDNIGYLDIDMAADPLEFNRLFPHLKDNTIVIGSRILRGNLEPIQRPRYRNILSRLYTLYFSLLFDTKIHDTQCGLKLFKKKDVLPKINSIKTSGFAFDAEFIIKMLANGLRIQEIPIDWHHVNGSKLNVHKAVFMMSNDLLRIWLDILKNQINETSYSYRISRPKSLFKAIIIINKVLTKIKTNMIITNTGKYTNSY